MTLCVTKPGVFEKIFLLQKLGNMPKIGFLEFIEKFGHRFSMNLFYNEKLDYLLCSCTNPISEKNLVPEI